MLVARSAIFFSSEKKKDNLYDRIKSILYLIIAKS